MDSTPQAGQRTIAPLFTWRSAIAESDLPPTTRHVLLTLSTYMNERGGSAYPGSARLAKDSGLHQATVKHHLALASRLGWLRIVRKGGSDKGGHRIATEYVAAVPVDNRPGAEGTGSSEDTDRGSWVTRPGAEDDPITSVSTPENSRVATRQPDPACVQCRGVGHYPSGAGFERPCPCCDDRPVVAIAP